MLFNVLNPTILVAYAFIHLDKVFHYYGTTQYKIGLFTNKPILYYLSFKPVHVLNQLRF